MVHCFRICSKIMGRSREFVLVKKPPANKLLRVLCILLCFVVVVILTVFAIILIWWKTGKFETEPTLPPFPTPKCTSGWEETARLIVEAVDPRIDPCKDFYRHACGIWMERHPLTNQSEINPKVLLQEEIANLMANFTDAVKTRSALFKTAHRILRSCFDNDDSKMAEDSSRLLKILSEYGGWPIITPDWASDKFKLWTFAGAMSSKYLIHSLLTARIGPDWKNPEKKILFLNQATLTLPSPEYYQDKKFEKVMETYRKLIETVSELLAKSAGTFKDIGKDIPLHAESILEFERRLAGKVSNLPLNYTQRYSKLSRKDLEVQFPLISWANYLDNLQPNNWELTEVVVLCPEFLHKLELLIESVSEKTLANYLLWRFIFSRIQYTSIRSETQALNLESGLNFPTSNNFCVSFSSKFAPFLFGRIFIEQLSDKFPMSEISLIIKEIQMNAQSGIGDVKWLTTPTKLNAFKKIQGLEINFGYPNWILSDSELDTFYSNLSQDISSLADEVSWFEISEVMVQDFSHKYWQGLAQPVHRGSWMENSPISLGLLYNYGRNSLIFPAANFLLPLFQSDFPKAWNYGSIGFLLARAFSQALDNSGVQFGPDGRLEGWLDPISRQNFSAMSNCFQSQYGNFCLADSDICVDGRQTLDQNLADNLGLGTAFLALKTFELANGGPEAPLPGLPDLSMDQVFFLSLAHGFCASESMAAGLRHFAADDWSPARIRLAALLANSPHFANTFKCPQKKSQVCTI